MGNIRRWLWAGLTALLLGGMALTAVPAHADDYSGGFYIGIGRPWGRYDRDDYYRDRDDYYYRGWNRDRDRDRGRRWDRDDWRDHGRRGDHDWRGHGRFDHDRR